MKSSYLIITIHNRLEWRVSCLDIGHFSNSLANLSFRRNFTNFTRLVAKGVHRLVRDWIATLHSIIIKRDNGI
jgi:hypothetical protein